VYDVLMEIDCLVLLEHNSGYASAVSDHLNCCKKEKAVTRVVTAFYFLIANS
jgi:hypothetical protein